jgi:hypothetical protein
VKLFQNGFPRRVSRVKLMAELEGDVRSPSM